jgi:hypothetical protein
MMLLISAAELHASSDLRRSSQICNTPAAAAREQRQRKGIFAGRSPRESNAAELPKT